MCYEWWSIERLKSFVKIAGKAPRKVSDCSRQLKRRSDRCVELEVSSTEPLSWRRFIESKANLFLWETVVLGSRKRATSMSTAQLAAISIWCTLDLWKRGADKILDSEVDRDWRMSVCIREKTHESHQTVHRKYDKCATRRD